MNTILISNFRFPVPHYKKISIEDFTYELLPDKIALYPLEERDCSNLLVYNSGIIEKDIFRNIANRLPHDSLIVFNNTRVVQARLLFQKDTGAIIEVFCLEPAGGVHDIQIAFQQKKKSTWFCLVGNAKKWKGGFLELKTSKGMIIRARKGNAYKDGYYVEFEWSDEGLTFAEVLDEAGKTPLPPYITRKVEELDKLRYQTIFARHSGSVAAPTAGLHFTDYVLQSLSEKNIQSVNLTLHVGAGTFKPVTTPDMSGHIMHHEQVIFSKKTIKDLCNYSGKSIISVGTTSLRSLESLYWLGVKIINGYNLPETGFVISQWEPYEATPDTSVSMELSLKSVLNFMEINSLENIHGETSLIIVPGYKFRIANILVTNFHQPKSTLLLLVAAFCGDNWRSIYDYALKNEFRFLSYGDSCLLFRKDQITAPET